MLMHLPVSLSLSQQLLAPVAKVLFTLLGHKRGPPQMLQKVAKMMFEAKEESEGD